MQIKPTTILLFKAEITVQQMWTRQCPRRPNRPRRRNLLDDRRHHPVREVDRGATVDTTRTIDTGTVIDTGTTEINTEPNMDPRKNHAAEPALDREIEVGQVHGNDATAETATDERKNGKGHSMLLAIAQNSVTTQFVLPFL
jgi:hypothetical protein